MRLQTSQQEVQESKINRFENNISFSFFDNRVGIKQCWNFIEWNRDCCRSSFEFDCINYDTRFIGFNGCKSKLREKSAKT